MFSFSFRRSFPNTRGHLREIRERLSDYLIAIEFRHESWFNARHRASALKFERDSGFCNVTVDEPQGLPGSIPAVWQVTNSALTMFRLHGRNRETWNQRGLASASERFNYEYTQSELSEFVPRIHRLASEADDVHVICNVNFQDQGIRTATMMRQLLLE